jgi:hypothetical protein
MVSPTLPFDFSRFIRADGDESAMILGGGVSSAGYSLNSEKVAGC